jgi:hypothetical protein
MVTAIYERAKKLVRFSFPQDRGMDEYFFRRVESAPRKQAASMIVLAVEPTDYF